VIGAPPQSATAKQRAVLERARRLTALQVDTLTRAVVDIDDTVGWARLTELGTRSVTVAQESASTATADLLNATLNAADLVGDITSLPGIRPGQLASGKDVRGMFAMTRDVVSHRMTGGATFAEGLNASANKLVAIASSEPHRIGRDGQINQGLVDDRFNRYRRVAIGATCKFCLMLATRGAVYLTEQTARSATKRHSACDCAIELVLDAARDKRSGAPAPYSDLAKDWRTAIGDDARLNAAKIRREWADLTDQQVADLALSPRSTRAAREEFARRTARGELVERLAARPLSDGELRDLLDGDGSAAAHILQGADGQYRFTPQRAKLHAEIIEDTLKGAEPQANPRYNVMGGGPASGKSSMEKATPELAKNAVLVNADEFKLALPEYAEMGTKAAAHTHEESSYLVARATEESFARRLNVTLDGTGDASVAKLRGKIEAARDAGYTVHGHYISIPTDEAVDRAMARAAKTGRLVPEKTIRDTHRKVSAVLPEVLDDFDSVVLWDNTTRPLRMVLEKPSGGSVRIVDAGLWDAFKAKAEQA
jgi:predicted ABC-type ATPase